MNDKITRKNVNVILIKFNKIIEIVPQISAIIMNDLKSF